MKLLINYINLIIFAFIFFKCSDSSSLSHGCKDCNAINYDSLAVIDDSSCFFSNSNIISSYSVQDSIMEFSLSWLFDDYLIEITREDCLPNGILIKNYGNILNSDGSLIVRGIAIEDSIYIPSQIIDTGKDNFSTDYIEISESTGYFKNDSIFIALSYSNRYDPYIGNLFGIKIDN